MEDGRESTPAEVGPAADVPPGTEPAPGAALTPPARRAEDGPYRLRWATDLPIVAGTAGLWSTLVLLRSDQVRKSCPCSSASLPAFERIALGRDEGAGAVSDVLVGVAIAAPVLLDALDVANSRGAWTGYWEDVVVVAEAVLASGAINEVVKSAASRPRPRVHDQPKGDSGLEDPDNYTSFYSAHTSNAFAAGMAYAFTYAHRHPGDPWRWAVYGGALAVGGGVGAMRVAAGAHFPSDVIVGAVAGAAIGTVVPWLHLRSPTTNLAVAPADGGAVVGVSGTLP
ncbi:MAG TPA: phosphatase PAP2 family protein [Vulgatibacter sp.]